jgi:hypothetical protein
MFLVLLVILSTYMYHFPSSLIHIVKVRQREDPTSVSSTIFPTSLIFDAILIVVGDFVIIRTVRAIGFLHGVTTTAAWGGEGD